ncbi:metalloregulator ArsR/SmtB family transcription factor [Cellulomonas sp. ACRRI]|uniref:ArsR/SmtB family transcription factor n=1 Tax=Cellulomonas sp. ACRRI TaxID=2918188 RepID=UPI001EF1A123|nr:metalloregulator ArsR/SmtB family transcription factor [Cellulomonas sp. ACRRI]MCG7284764.1 metalloregulator ArsR/SmtB family transcription factor [Cellulomonas sp. ACRRI]
MVTVGRHSVTDHRGAERATLEHAVGVTALLADRTRLAILVALSGGRERSVSALASELGRPPAGISQHLARLRAGCLVTSRRVGTMVLYSANGKHVELLMVNVLRHSEHIACGVPPHHG